MARKTREEALVTKEHILNAAETLFLQKGVSHTSLHEIAKAASVTRGAVYWHFKDKVDLLQSLLDRAILPIEDITNAIVTNSQLSPEEKILTLTSEVATFLTNDQQLRNTIEIITYKVELVGEFAIMYERHMQHFTRMLNICTLLVEQEYKRRKLTATKEQLSTVSYTIYAISTGLLHNWLLTQEPMELHQLTNHAVSTYLHGLWSSTASCV